MSSVVVTGGMGTTGRWVVRWLRDAGWDVTCVDLTTPPDAGPGGTDVGGVEYRQGDLTNHGEAWELVTEPDPDAVVHMAGVPLSGWQADTRTFETNVESTYNVLHAAGRCGADVVWTSSDAAYGTVFAEQPWLPDYLPLDEEHPCRPEDAYGTAKLVGEQLGDSVARKYGIDVASLRPPLIEIPGEYKTTAWREQFDPETAERDGEFWSYVDVRDVASAIEAALETPLGGAERFVVAAPDNYLDRPTAAVIEAVYGDCPARCALEGDESAFSTEKARRVLDWEPQHRWRTAADESVPAPSVD